MGEATISTAELQSLLNRLRDGDVASRPLLVDWACQRLTTLARKRLRSFPRVRRWEQTDDVMQGAMMRLHRALDAVSPPSPADFFRLCGSLLRRELIDLERHYQGPHGLGAHHASAAPASSSDASPAFEPAQVNHDPAVLAEWSEFHAHVEALPADERDVFNLLWYQELSQEEAGVVLGVSVPTVKRRWRQARYLLGRTLRPDGEN